MSKARQVLKLLEDARQIGKRIGGAVYLHRDYEAELDQDALSAAKEVLGDFDYTIVKHDPDTGSFSFTQSPDWDDADEPTCGDCVVVKADGSTKKIAQGSDPWIYHHKWMFVGDDYAGFDVEQSKARSAEWEKIPGVDRSRIGKRSFWDKNVVSKMESHEAKKKPKAEFPAHPEASFNVYDFESQGNLAVMVELLIHGQRASWETIRAYTRGIEDYKDQIAQLKKDLIKHWFNE